MLIHFSQFDPDVPQSLSLPDDTTVECREAGTERVLNVAMTAENAGRLIIYLHIPKEGTNGKV